MFLAVLSKFMEKRKICAITGSRAEYGLLYWILRGILDTAGLELQLVVTGMHLSPEFGLTYRQIEEDGRRRRGASPPRSSSLRSRPGGRRPARRSPDAPRRWSGAP